jgi:hypothetical protein
MPAGPPPNPYIIDQPLENDTAFFGREDIIQEVERTLRYPNHVSVILAGQRQIGKTSLLLALARRLPAPPFFSVYFDLADKALIPVGQVLYEIAVTAAQKGGMSPPLPDDFENNPDTFHKSFLPALYQAIGSGHCCRHRKTIVGPNSGNGIKYNAISLGESGRGFYHQTSAGAGCHSKR